VRNARQNRAVHGKDCGDQEEPAQKQMGQLKRWSRLRQVFLSQDPVCGDIQGFLRLLAEPRSQHSQGTRQKRDTSKTEAGVDLRSSTARPPLVV